MTLFQQKKILIVEDDTDIRELMADILSEEGYLISTAVNGKIGFDYLLALAPEDRPDCIILDLMMPVMTGLQVLETLQKNYPNDLGKIPVIIATAKGSPKDELENLPSNVQKIRKPMDLNELISTVERQCQNSSAELRIN